MILSQFTLKSILFKMPFKANWFVTLCFHLYSIKSNYLLVCVYLLTVAFVLTYKVSLGVQKVLTNKMYCYYYWYHSHTFVCRPEFSAYWILEKHILVLSYLSQPAFCTWPHLKTIYMEARLPNTYIFILIPKLFSWKKVFFNLYTTMT